MATQSWKDILLHYKKKLEKGPSEEKILEIFGKLKRVPITVELLKETSVGKCVNGFKNTPGDVGDEARLLVSNWKGIVKPTNNHNQTSSACSSESKSYKEGRDKSHKHNYYEEKIEKSRYKNSYLDNSDEDRPNDGEYSPRTNAQIPILDEKKYLSQGSFRDSEDNERGESYNPTMTVNDYKSYRKYQGSDSSLEKPRSGSKYSSHSSVERNPKSERKKDAISPKKEIASQPNTSKGSSSSKHSSSKSSERRHGEKSKKKLNKDLDEFTNSVASFEDCLGLNDAVKSKSKMKTKPISTPVNSRSSGSSTKHASVDNSVSYDPEYPQIKSTSSYTVKAEPAKRKLEKIEPRIPEDLKKPKRGIPLEVDILSTLPDIQPNYKPLPHKFMDENIGQKKKTLSNEEAILFTSSRNEKTAVYAGRRQGVQGDVSSLFESCIRVLIENIDGLGYTGGVPYDLLKPVLEKCTPAQLYTFEDYNSYLLEETDELWHVHCVRDFKSKAPDETETWRDMYLRLYDEREERLKNITANISASMRKAVPVRTTKLAYVDSVAKPPRDVARRQVANGTALPNGFKLKGGPATKSNPRPIAGFMNSSHAAASSQSSSSSQNKKPKVAPLMQKTLKLMKQRFRR